MKTTTLEQEEEAQRRSPGRAETAWETADVPPARALDDSAVRALAYQRWLQRGAPEGSPDEDWHWAERELRRAA